MSDKGGRRGNKISKKWVTSFMDGAAPKYVIKYLDLNSDILLLDTVGKKLITNV